MHTEIPDPALAPSQATSPRRLFAGLTPLIALALGACGGGAAGDGDLPDALASPEALTVAWRADAPPPSVIGYERVEVAVRVGGEATRAELVATGPGAAPRAIATAGPPGFALTFDPAAAGLTDGEELTLTVAVTDASGARAETSRAAATVDWTPPTLVSVVPPSGSVLSPVEGCRFTFADASPLDVGRTEVNVVHLGAGGLATLVEGSDYVRDGTTPGELSLILQRPTDGEYRVTMTPVDAARNRGATERVVLWSDTTAPVATIAAPPAGGFVTAGRMRVVVDAIDASGVARLNVTARDTFGGVAEAEIDGESALDVDVGALADGPLAVAAIVTDRAGFTGAADVALTLDLVGPVVEELLPEDGASVPERFVISLGARDAGAGLASVELRWADAPELLAASSPCDPDGRATLAVEATGGLREALVTVRDAVGHRTELSRTWRVDDDLPVADLEPAPGLSALAALPMVRVHVADQGAGPDLGATASELLLSRDGVPLAPVVGLDEATDTLLIALPPGAGRFELAVTPVDRVGHRGATTRGSWLVDTTPPTVALEGVAEGALVAGDALVVTVRVADDDAIAAVELEVIDARGARGVTALSTDGGVVTVDLTALPEGRLTLGATARDVAGHTSRAEVTCRVDDAPPELLSGLPADGPVGASLALALAVRDAVGGVARCGITAGAGPAAEATFEPPIQDGVCSLALDFDEDGPRDVEVLIEDAVGHVTAAARRWIVDGTPPTGTMAPEGALVGDLPTVRATLADVGAGLDLGASAASAKVYRNGVEVPDGVLVWVEGEEVVALEVMEAGPGVWTFQVTPVDAVGNVGDAVSARYTLDTGDPSVVITAPPAGAWVGGSLAAAAVASDVESAVERVHFEVSDALGATRVAELDAPPWEAALDLTGLAPGPLTLRASAWDAADNSAEATRAVRRDDLAPTVSVRAPSTAELVGPSATLTVAASDAESGLADVSVRVGDAQGELLTEGALTGAEGERTLALTRPLAHGVATLWVGARDAVGNVGGVVQVVSVDARAPTVSASPPAGTRLPGGATVTLTLRDGDDGFASGPDAAATAGTLVVRAGGLPTAHFTAAAEGDAISVTFNAALDGPVTVAVTPVDQLGNAGLPAIIDYVVDQRAPSATLTPSGVTATQITAITARFDEAVAEATVDLDDGLVATVDGERLAGSLTYASDARALTLRPDGLLPAGATVEVALAPGVADLLGNVATTTQRAAFTVGAPSFVDLVPWIDGLSLYRGETGERGEQHGPGGTFTDLDGDSYPDLALATGPGLPPELWLNVPTPLGTGRTLSRVPLSDATLAGQAGIIAADYDNDGDQDLFVVCYRGENVLLRNDLVEVGVFGFTDVTEATRPVGAGPDQLGVKAGTELGTPLLLSMTAAWSDVNRDGLLDLYVGHHNGVYRAPDLGTRAGERDTLFLQQPDGTFVDVTMDAGVPGWQHQDGRYVTGAQRYSSTNGVVFADLNHDRWPDLIVTNKLRSADDRDMVYLNLGADASGEWLGFHPITYELPGNFGATNPLAMGIAPNDVDNDGDIDFYVTDWSPFGVVPGPNELWLNQFVETGHVGFLVDRSCCTGVYSWGAQLEDLDNDGLVDIHVATNVRETDIVYRQTSPGFFAVSGAAWGVNQVANSRGDLAADFNRDGWLDLFIVNDNEAPRLYLSQLERASSDRHWISIRLIGDPTLPGPYRSSRDAIGARVTITADIDGDGVDEHLTRMVFSGTGSGASTSSLEVEAGLGADAVVDVLIRWPSGRDTLLLDVAADQFLTVTEGP